VDALGEVIREYMDTKPLDDEDEDEEF